MFANFASGMYWIMMDQVTAIVCTVMTFGMMPLWYHYSLRIYNRFYWGDIDVDKWEDQKHGRSGGDADDSKSFDPTDSGGMYDGVATGYMSMKGNKRMGIKPWQRLFFVLEGQLMHYYRDQYSYERSPATALNKRPIDLDGYTIVAGGVEPPFTLVLVPRDPEDIRRTYHFRVDTRVEFERWVEAFAAALTPAAAAAAAAAAAQWQQQGVEEQLLDLASDANEGAAAGAGFAGSGSVIRLEGDVANHPALQRLLAEEEEEDADEDASTQPPAEGNPVVAHL